MTKFKVLHVITTLNRGGAEKQLLVLTREQVEQGHDVSVVHLKGDGQLKSEFQRIGIETFDFHKFNSVVSLLKLNALLKILKPDVVHAHLPRSEVFVACVCGLRKIKFVVTRHNSEAFFPRFKYSISSVLSKMVLRRAHKIICISEDTKRYLIEHSEVCKKNTISLVTIKYGYDRTQVIAPPKSDFSYRLGTISRLTEQKNIALQIEALAKLRDSENRKWKLLIVGQGELENSLKDLVEKLDLSKQVEFVRHVEDVRMIFQSIDVFVLSSLYEGFGLVLLEAMQHNVPILASGVSAIPEVLSGEYEGFFDPKDSDMLATLIAKSEAKDFREELIRHYSQNLQRFDPRIMSELVTESYL